MKNIKKETPKNEVNKELNHKPQLKIKTQIKAGYYLSLTISAGAEKAA